MKREQVRLGVFYVRKLHAADGLGRQEILGETPFCGLGLRVVEVPQVCRDIHSWPVAGVSSS